MKTKVTTIIGTRPEIIRMSEIVKRFDEVFDHRLLHTGQNFDKKLNNIFFDSMKLRKPDVQLNFNSTSLASQLSQIFQGVEKELVNNRPEAVVILGDTNSGLSAILAKRMNIPVYHLEGGNRAFDINVPEETNRKIIDHTSDFNLVYSENARRNLLAEGVHSRSICLIGSPMREVVNANKIQIETSTILSQLLIDQGQFFLVSIHRQENITLKDRWTEIFKSISEIANVYKIPVIVSTHPRVRQMLENTGKTFDSRVKFLDPFGFHEYCKLQQSARIVLSDSGSLSEEAAIMGFRAITLRDSMERPEALEAGVTLMCGLEFKSIQEAISVAESNKFIPIAPPEYDIPDTSERVTRFIVSTLGRHGFWSGQR